MKKFSVFALVALAIVAVIVAVVAVTARSSESVGTGRSENYDSMTSAALSDYETNAANTDNVYQQQVVAAWGAKDLLTVIAKQNSVAIDNQNALLASQAASVINQHATLTLLKSLVVIGAVIVLALAVLGGMLAIRQRPAPQTESAPAVESGAVPPTVF